MAVILAFGDSITYGSWSPIDTSWCSLLRSHMDKKFDGNYSSYGRVYNLGIGGETTDDAIKRFLPETQARLRDEEEIVFIIAYGANDACFIASEQKFKVALGKFAPNIQKILTEAKTFSSKIMLLNILPVVERPKEDSGQTRLNKHFEQYNQKLAQIAQENTVVLVDVNTAFQKTNYAILLGTDGLHPNEKGHQVIFELVSKEVDKYLRK
jgi:acyl-CoA thioesterase-1